jgi:uncharacterized protein YndB with AHSA1/START domain
VADELRNFATAPSIHLERDYTASADELWAAWTDPQQLSRWLCTSAAPFLTMSGPARLWLGDGEDQWVDVEVLVSEPPHRLELAWRFAGDVDSVLQVRIERVNDSTSRVKVHHSGLGPSTLGYGAGWQAYLVILGDQLGSIAAERWTALFEEYLPIWRAKAMAHSEQRDDPRVAGPSPDDRGRG